ncbi:uncharacterized protein LOC117319026 [Pecten maximus]|uniref:uncharacterized protein LOC117319026 n=1 Tax=Pecten maximus TaxID=6579 RepID=UPI001458FA8F|nr:uncharacterized protein LOC117319026 [Pecten maximus]
MIAIEYGQREIAHDLACIMPPNTLAATDCDNNRNVHHYMAAFGRPWDDVWRKISRESPMNLHQKDVIQMTPLDLVIRNREQSRGNRSLFESVIKKGDMTDEVNNYAKKGDLENLKKLYRSGCPMETQSKTGKTSVMLAIFYNKESTALFLTKVTSVYYLGLKDDNKWNALHYIAFYGRLWIEIWQMFCQKHPVLPYEENDVKFTPMELVAKNINKSSEHKRLYEYVKNKELPAFVKDLDEADISDYVCGLAEHAELTRNIKIMFIGHHMVGKTCLVKQLFGENIDLHNHHSTNVAELHLRRLLLDMLTLERISGTAAKDIVLERLRMIISKIEDGNGKIEQEPKFANESDETEVTTLPAHSDGNLQSINVEEFNQDAESESTGDIFEKFAQGTESQNTDADDSHATLFLEHEVEIPQATTEVQPEILTPKQKEVMNLVLHQEANDQYKSKAFVTMYDFGGEDIFYNTHHSLMTSDSIFLLVFNAAMCLNEKEEGLGSIVKWLQSVATYAVDVEDSRKGIPPVLLIGSHMDLVDGPEKQKREKLEIILDKLKSVPGLKEVIERHIKGLFPISHLNDSSRNKDVFLKMWKTIADIAPLQSQWKKRIPGKWIALEFELLQKKELGVKVMTIEELMELNKELALPLDGVGSLKLFLRYLHLTGFMLCFDLESENPIIVLDPQWVIDAFKCLITAIKFVCGLTYEERTLWKQFEETGRLPVEVLKMLWGKHPESKFLDQMHVLVAVMERLGLLVKPLPNEKDEKVNYYVVPSMLKTAGDTETEMMTQILFESTTAKSCTLCVQFQKRFIPRAIWDKFIAACIHRFQPFEVPGKPRFSHCHRGFVALAIDPFWNILIHCSGNVMKLTLFKMKDDSPVVPGTGHAIRVVLAEVLQQILTMNQQGHLEFDYYLHCHPIVRPRDEAVEAKLLLQTSPLTCVQIDAGVQKTEPIHRQHYDVWFQSLEENPAQHIPGVDLLRRPTYRELGRIAKFIYEAHHMFFIELGLRDAEISQIRQTCGHLSFRTQVTEIFLSWRNTRPDASYSRLSWLSWLHLRRLLLDMLTLERISGTAAKDIVLERLRMIISKIEDGNGKIEQEPKFANESDETEVTTLPAHSDGNLQSINVEEFNQDAESESTGDIFEKFAQGTESQNTDADDSHATLFLEHEVEIPQATTEVQPEILTPKQKEVMNLVLHQEANDQYKSKAFVTMYDFGGEDIFYNTHHSLMTSDSIFLLVFNAAMCLNEKEEGLGSIVKWLQSVATYAVDVEDSRKGIPPVLLIGSHMDLVDGPE